MFNGIYVEDKFYPQSVLDDATLNQVFSEIYKLGKKVRTFKEFRKVSNEDYYDLLQDVCLYFIQYIRKYSEYKDLENIEREIVINCKTLSRILQHEVIDVRRSKKYMFENLCLSMDLDYIKELFQGIYDLTYNKRPDVNAFCEWSNKCNLQSIKENYNTSLYEYSVLEHFYNYICDMLGVIHVDIHPNNIEIESDDLYMVCKKVYRMNKRLAKNYLIELQRCLTPTAAG